MIPGYGLLPKDDIISWKKLPFYPNLVDHLLIRHRNKCGVEDGMLICYFKPYSQGRTRWQGDTVHGVWFDEEPPYAIYSEGLTRTNKYGQFPILTFTPLMVMSEVVIKFIKEPSKHQKVVNMTIYDADHYTDWRKRENYCFLVLSMNVKLTQKAFPQWEVVIFFRSQKKLSNVSHLNALNISM